MYFMYTLVKFMKSDLLVYLPGGPVNYFIAERTDTKCGPGVHFNFDQSLLRTRI